MSADSNKLVFNFGFINLNHARAAANLIENDVLQKDLDLVRLNEPYYYQGSICGCPRGYKQIAVNGEPRVAIFVKDTIKFVTLEKERDLIVLMTNWNNIDYLIINFYCPPSANLESSIARLESICVRFVDNRVIIFGDFNAKNSAWSPRPTDERGRLVLEFVNKLDFSIENSCDSIATYSCEKGESWIDLVISKNIDRSLVANWQVHDQITASDHRLITYTLSESPRQGKRRIIWKLENLKILEFKSEMSKLVSYFSKLDLNKENLEETLSNFCTRVVKICIKCRKNKGKARRNNSVWWTQSLEIERSRVRALRRRFQACLEQVERSRRRIVFKREFAKYKKHVVSAKTSSFRGFLGKLVNKNHMGIVKDVLKLGNIELRIEKIRLASGAFIEKSGECRDYILKFHFPVVQVEDTMDSDPILDEVYPEFTLNEIEMCISRMKRDKAPGEDGLSLGIIEEIFYADNDWFVKVFNLCLKFGIFPKIWKESRVVLIPKSNKDLSNPESYRPICLLPVWGKILDKLMTHRLVYFLESNKLLDHRQYGFREGMGTLTALRMVNNFIDCAKNEKMITCMISLDIKNAFNSIRWEDIISLLKIYKIPGKLLILFKSFLNNRSVILEDGSKWNYNIGVPQGSSCGPILWLIVANEALKMFPEQSGSLVQAFADDFVILIKASASYSFTEISKDFVSCFESWAEKFNLRFSENKTKYIMIKAKKNVTHYPGIHLYGKRIGYTNELKYLGIVFDPNYSFMTHLQRVLEKIVKINEKLRRLVRATWGLRPELAKEIYQTILEKIILYGVEIWYRDGTKMNMKLLQIQRYPLLSITKAYKTTSNEALQVLSGCLPIDLRAQMTCEMDSKLRGVNNVPTSIVTDFELEEKIIPWEVLRINWNLYKNTSSSFSVFTDGSKMNNRVGSAYVIYCGNDEIDFSTFRLSDNSSVFMAEAFAISKAVDEIIFRRMEYVDLITDSRSTLMSLYSLKEKRCFINSIKRKIVNYEGRINLKWVKAHEGTRGNERADFLAKLAIDKDEIDICFGETKSEIKLSVKNKMMQR
ncbi:Putative protein in type-1 retrotransposable element R1DM [Araneus ventricosus]|uniref:Retrovirus-related Pol polyprotein from type-1 retrotransposable element R1 n=1 Tax=Araneus ventricosus TaxID=182803 RepID=A0A4Y2BTU8_ARAVE|nr:Putative protein in type-1 retrotransposable element R1DM [Araneus ventricosus]